MKISVIFGVLAIVFLVLSIFTGVPLWIALACLCVAVVGLGTGH